MERVEVRQNGVFANLFVFTIVFTWSPEESEGAEGGRK